MTTDYRALCAELADALDTWIMAHHHGGVPPQDGADAELVLRARTALAQPEPEGPTDEGIQRIALSLPATCDWSPEHTHWTKSWNVSLTGLLIFARAVISEMPTTLAQPEPVELTDEELDEMYYESGGVINAFARSVIAADRVRLGRHAIKPVPQSEA